MKKELPKGKITARLRSTRGVYQCYIGRNYISGCAGETCEEVIEWLKLSYDVPSNTKMTVYGHCKPSVTYIN